MVSTASVTVGVPSSTVVGARGLDVLDGRPPAPRPTRSCRWPPIDLDPARSGAGGGDLVRGVGHACRWPRRPRRRWTVATNCSGSVVGVGRVVVVDFGTVEVVVLRPVRRRAVVVDGRAGRGEAGVRLVAADEGQRREERHTTTTTITIPVPPPAPVVHRVERHALGPVGAPGRGRSAPPPSGRAPVRRPGVVEDDRGVRVGELVGAPDRHRRDTDPVPGRTEAVPGGPAAPGSAGDRPHGGRADPLGQVLEGAQGVVVVPDRVGVVPPGSPDRATPTATTTTTTRTNATAHIRPIQP